MYKKGNAFEELEHNGWFYGSFMPDGIAKDERVEVKVIKLGSDFSSGLHYNKTSTKIDVVWSGKAIWEVEGKEIEMTTGDYLIMQPNTVVALKKVLTDELVVQTIRFPSIPDDKVMV